MSKPQDFEELMFRKMRKEYSPKILNAALELATEWGENFRKPIEGRLLERFPDLTSNDAAAIEKIVRQAENTIYDLAEKEINGKINERQILPTAKSRFPWINDEHVSRLTNIGRYYAIR